jgi:hypothetical protein
MMAPKGSVYRYQHFETRDKLIKATAEWVSDKLFRAVFADPATLGERRVEHVDVADLTDRLANFGMEDPELCRIWLVQVLSSPDPTSDRLWKEYEGSTARFARTKLTQDALQLASQWVSESPLTRVLLRIASIGVRRPAQVSSPK